MKTHLFLSFLSIALFAGKISAQIATTASVKDPIQVAIDLYDQHKYKDAIVQLNTIIKDDPKNGKAFYYRGMSKMHDKQKGFCKDLEESLLLGYSNKSDIYYYGCETQDKKGKD